MLRENFDKQTIEQLKLRAAYICSNPDCRCSTVAPSEADENSVIYNGIIAHITAAAPGGPRYDVTLSTAERGHINNGVFLCANCSIMIDKNGGVDCPAYILREWKIQHEDFIRGNLNKRPQNQLTEVNGEISASGIGEVIGLDIKKPTKMMPGTKVTATGIGNITGTRIG